jgi:hypothetical protein
MKSGMRAAAIVRHDYTSENESGPYRSTAGSMVSLLCVYGRPSRDAPLPLQSERRSHHAALSALRVIFLPLFAVSTASAHTVTIRPTGVTVFCIVCHSGPSPDRVAELCGAGRHDRIR